MGKTLKTVGMVLGAAAMIATGVGALAMPGLAGSVTLFGVSTGTLNLASAGLTAVGGLLDKPQSTGSGSPSDWTSNPDQPTPFAFGRVGVAGKVIHRDEYGKDNKLQGIVSVFSGAGPIRGFVSYKADDLAVSFESNGGTAIGKYRRQMWRSWRLGAQPDTALSLPTGLDEGAVMPGWGPAYRLSGKACDLLTVQQDSKFSVYPSGVPTPMVELDGIYGYDPRFDDTYPGGVGPCRLGVRSTYLGIDNPIIGGLNWALGMVENGQVVGGIGASIHGIDVPAFVEAANVADANDWKVTAWPDTSEDASQVLRQFLQAGGASYARHAGKISCVTRGAARPSIVTITARDTCGPLELDTGSSSFNRLNTITPEFMSAAHGWKHVPTDPVTYASLRAEDGGKKSDRIQYRFVPSAKQAGQLAAYDILDAREPFSGTIPLKPHLRRLKRGDCFTLSEPGFLLDGVKFIVLGRTYDAQKGEVRLAFRSETDGKHDLALGKTATMPEYPGLTPADPTVVSPPNPDDWVITPRPPGPGGTQLPMFDFWGAVSNATATAVVVEISYTNEWPGEVVYSGPPTTEKFSIMAEPGEEFWLAVMYQRGLNYSERLIFGPYTAPALIADIAPDAPALIPLKEQIERNAKRLLLEISQSWNRSKDEREYSISREELMTKNVLRTVEVLEIADADNLVRIEIERLTRITEMANETLIRQQQVSGLGDNLAIIDTRSLTTASNLATFTETASVQISSLGGNLAVVDARSQTSASELVSLTSTTTGLLSSYNGLNSTVIAHATAISGLELQNNLARLDLEVAAGGGQPARFSLISGATGTAAAIMADSLWIGENFFFQTATRTMQTLAPGGMRRVWGAGFGVDGLLDEWRGPANIAVSAMTVANSVWAVKASDGKTYYGGAELGSGGSGGSAVKAINGGPGASGATITVSGVKPGSYLKVSGALIGGSLSADATWTGVMYLTEDAGGGTTTHQQVPIEATSSGLMGPGGGFEVGSHSSFASNAFAGRSGTVTYTVHIVRTGGPAFVQGAEIGAVLEILSPT